MANDTAWQAGMDIAAGGKYRKGKKDDGGPQKYSKPVGQITTSDNQTLTPSKPMAFKKGGKVKKTGVALVHKGEVVLTKAEAKRYKKTTKKRVASKR